MDLYYASTDEYIAAGRKLHDFEQSGCYIVKVNTQGDLIWENTYNMGEAFAIIEADNGDFVAAGDAFSAIRINPAGEEIWINGYGGSLCRAIIELKNGDFILAGYSNRQGYLVCINGDGDRLWTNEYGAEEDRNHFYTMRETEGGVVVAGYVDSPGRTWDVWIIKVDFGGELLWSRIIQSNVQTACKSMVSTPDQGFVLTGLEQFQNGYDIFLLKIDGEGNPVWSRSRNIATQYAYGMEKTREGDFLVAGMSFYDVDGFKLPHLLKVNSQGIIRWSHDYDLRDSLGIGRHWNDFRSVIIGADNSMIAAGRIDNRPNELGYDGIIVKIGGEFQEPGFVAWSPEDTVFTTVLGDTIDFWVQVEDQQGDELSYLWIFNQLDTLSINTNISYVFDELGEHNMKCLARDDEFTIELDWRVIVQRFAVESFTPDTLDLSIRRAAEVDFSVGVRVLEDVEVEFLWVLTDRNGQENDIGDADNVTVPFDLPGEYQLQCFASNDVEVESIIWDISVQSVVWWWWPHEFEISAYQDTTMEFAVFPFDEESELIEYAWFLDDEVLDCDTSFVELQFPDVGQFEITSIVREDVEVDTINWTINVEEWSFTTDLTDLADLPTSPVLCPASPNPFNSTVKLSVYLPKADHVFLSVFDVNGREVSRLVDWKIRAGDHTFFWNAGDFPTGVYVVRMCAGDIAEMQKVVLVR